MTPQRFYWRRWGVTYYGPRWCWTFKVFEANPVGRGVRTIIKVCYWPAAWRSQP